MAHKPQYLLERFEFETLPSTRRTRKLRPPRPQYLLERCEFETPETMNDAYTVDTQEPGAMLGGYKGKGPRAASNSRDPGRKV